MSKTNDKLFHDLSLILIMGVLAGCGLIYEYLLSHYAGRILGSVETAIYGMIGIMIVAMGVGSFSAKYFKNPFTAFACLEVLVAAVGAGSVLVIAAVVGFVVLLPQAIVETYGLPFDINLYGSFIKYSADLVSFFPFFVGFILGFLLGMEIPLIARVRETLHKEHLQHNTGMIYGVDYIGAGLGAAIWVLFMLRVDITTAASLTASANLLAGLFFLLRYWAYISMPLFLLFAHVFVALLVALLFALGEDTLTRMSNVLYKDKVVHSESTNYQHFSITERHIKNKATIYSLYINGRLQFASNDEVIYHSMLVYPALYSSARTEKILVIGGGDGLALRDILRWNPKEVTLVDLDNQLLDFFKGEFDGDGELPAYQKALVKLNESSLNHPTVDVINGDAFIEIDQLLDAGNSYDAIIVDLPDPSHPDLNKLYSNHFYVRLRQLLAGDGVMAVQSTSPFHAKKAFLSIGKTIRSAGFSSVEQYHQNVPSFGEWGWTIATKMGKSPFERLKNSSSTLPVNDAWVTKDLMLAAFQFSTHFFSGLPEVKINKLGSHQLYHYHHQAWAVDEGMIEQAERVE
ncbi:MAG: polyamine aminopropyltransferase [Pseudomonadales bacterium]|nr:polyamine aminopropyltransferase [Pseudomonadales bacterium]